MHLPRLPLAREALDAGVMDAALNLHNSVIRMLLPKHDGYEVRPGWPDTHMERARANGTWRGQMTVQSTVSGRVPHGLLATAVYPPTHSCSCLYCLLLGF